MATQKILIGIRSKKAPEELILAMASRHGLITGATGTGKTVTLQRLAEQFSLAGIPVFTADVKGDIAGLSFAGLDNPKLHARFKELQVSLPVFQACPVVFWDLYGKTGIPLRTTVSEVGPLLMGRILDANNIQQGIIDAAFSYADNEGLLLLDLKDLRSLLDWMVDNSNELKTIYGNISRSSVGALQRSILSLNEAGGDKFFGEPALKLEHLMLKDSSGRGIINILDATKLIHDPRLYSTFLLWLLSELFEKLPEVGDIELPKLVFFFDESHLLFDSAPKVLLDKIEQMIRLIRSKGVGVYFVSQNPLDIPEVVLGQLGNRVQHALRAFTPKDQKAVRVAAETFRQNPKLDTARIISELGVGEALVSFLEADGTPAIVNKASILAPGTRMGTITSEERAAIVNSSLLYSVYQNPIDRDSAYEMIKKKIAAVPTPIQFPEEKPRETIEKVKNPVGRPRQTVAEVFVKSTVRTLGSKLGQKIIRGVLGSILGGKK